LILGDGIYLYKIETAVKAEPQSHARFPLRPSRSAGPRSPLTGPHLLPDEARREGHPCRVGPFEGPVTPQSARLPASSPLAISYIAMAAMESIEKRI
jgi:hypothetical protein